MSFSLFKWPLILFPFFLFSCNGHRPSAYEEQMSAITDTISRASFPKTGTLKFEKTGFKSDDAFSMAIADTFILLVTPKLPRALTVLSSESYKPLAEIIPKDRGKGHILSVVNILNTSDTGVIWLYDATTVKFLKVDIKKAVSTDNYEGEKEFIASKPGCALMATAWINDSTYAGCSFFSNEERFMLFNDSFQPLKKIGILPPALPGWPKDNPKGTSTLRALGYCCKLVKHPEKHKYVIAYDMTSRMEFYDSSNLVKVLRGPDVFDPLYQFIDRDGMTVPKVYKDTHLNCIAVQADSKYIYMLYSGQPKRFKYGRQLLIFDWNGNPVKWYDLPDTYKTFSITHKGDRILIYAIRYKANELEYSEISI